VLRFGWFYGPGAAHSEQLFALARRHIGLVLGPPASYVSSIHMADAAAAVAAALHAPAGTFNIVDDEPLPKREYAEALARGRQGHVGARAWQGWVAVRRSADLADPLAAGQQRTVPGRSGSA
jgi:nucleoside-diphosphate-sugar epimerase